MIDLIRGRSIAREVTLTRAMDKILNRGGSSTFLLDRGKGETRLDVSFMSEVSWSGTKR